MVIYTLRWISVAFIYASKVGSVYNIEPFITQKVDSLDEWKRAYIIAPGLRCRDAKERQKVARTKKFISKRRIF